MLGAGTFTASALHTVGGFTANLPVNNVVVVAAGPGVKLLFCIQTGEQFRNRDALTADFGAVVAAGAGDQVLGKCPRHIEDGAK